MEEAKAEALQREKQAREEARRDTEERERKAREDFERSLEEARGRQGVAAEEAERRAKEVNTGPAGRQARAF